MSDKPLVSVILPCFNAEEFLAEALDSVLAQTHDRLEVVTIDDGSTDGTRALLESYEALDRRIKVLVNGENRGVIETLNRGVLEARGELLARMDADDVVDPGRIELQVEFLSRRPDVGVVGTGARLIDRHGRVVGSRAVRSIEVGATRFMALFATPVLHPTILARADIMRANPYGGRDDCLHAEDYEVFARMLRAGAGFANLADPLHGLRVSEGSVSRRFETIQVENFVSCATRHLEASTDLEVPEAAHRVLVNRMSGTETIDDLKVGLAYLDQVVDMALANTPNAAPGREEIRDIASQQRADILFQALKLGRPEVRPIALALLARQLPTFLRPAVRDYLLSKLGRR